MPPPRTRTKRETRLSQSRAPKLDHMTRAAAGSFFQLNFKTKPTRWVRRILSDSNWRGSTGGSRVKLGGVTPATPCIRPWDLQGTPKLTLADPAAVFSSSILAFLCSPGVFSRALCVHVRVASVKRNCTQSLNTITLKRGIPSKGKLFERNLMGLHRSSFLGYNLLFVSS